LNQLLKILNSSQNEFVILFKLITQVYFSFLRWSIFKFKHTTIAALAQIEGQKQGREKEQGSGGGSSRRSSSSGSRRRSHSNSPDHTLIVLVITRRTEQHSRPESRPEFHARSALLVTHFLVDKLTGRE
jgi:hypothetical protein